jgi:hypothetical protein
MSLPVEPNWPALVLALLGLVLRRAGGREGVS